MKRKLPRSLGNMVICLENGKRCAVMLSNGVTAERAQTERFMW